MVYEIPLHRLERPLSQADLTTYNAALSQLQGNILKSHGRAAAVHVFLNFHPGKQREARRFLARLAKRQVTSAVEQRQDTQLYRDTHRTELFTALYFSAKGYEYLRVPLAGFSDEFRNGMGVAAAKLSDPPPDDWEPKFKEIQFMVLFAHDRVEELMKQLRSLEAAVAGYADISSELGISIHNQIGQVVEHFGYVDGISQPLFFENDFKVKAFSKKNWDPGAGPSLVVTPDPRGSGNDYGTYFVFRKLEQNVREFRKKTLALAKAVKLSPGDVAQAGAMIIGRFPDGTPVALQHQASRSTIPANDFRYSEVDPDGNRCPFSAHIRKVNPRGESLSLGADSEQERRHRIARRGITYGHPPTNGDDLDSLPETGVGLLFQCCQSDLKEQFEFIQGAWANQDNAPRPSGGKDPVIGQSANGAFHQLQFPASWGSAERKRFSLHSVVTMKGGEYLFAPSISFLKSLA
jgi:Dyp-type peroxidase family